MMDLMPHDSTLLEREMYSEAEAARLLRVPQGTLHYWLEGGVRGDRTYEPVIREASTGRRTVTWAEFVEAGLLREYRRTHQIPMEQLRHFIESLRHEFGVPYPLAHQRPLVSGRELVEKAQTESNLDADFCLVAVSNGQLILTGPGADFVERVTWEHDIATGWRPHDDPRSLVRVDPDVRFGRPSVAGISTEAIWERDQAGYERAEIADEFGISLNDVTWALAYESTSAAA
jgi:uncharacterized protein (DUF433 family)